ncbi:hypothetical protein ONZ45_g18570 [Pleurotus djamor]|nr:hypothetical protein ONZ45_g18570 [Pleurotus djamor]
MVGKDVEEQGRDIGWERHQCLKAKTEPIRCLKCQEYGHLVKTCKKEVSVCSTCAAHHDNQGPCPLKDQKAEHQCVACKTKGHASWERACPTRLRLQRELDQRHESNRLPYFPTDEPWTLRSTPFYEGRAPTITLEDANWKTVASKKGKRPDVRQLLGIGNPPLDNANPTLDEDTPAHFDNAYYETEEYDKACNLHDEFDVILIQEPYIDFQGLSRANRRWKILYPTKLSDDQMCRSLILVNDRISTDDYEQVSIPNTGDVTAVKISCNLGDLHIFNVYNDGHHNRALEILRSETDKIHDDEPDPMIMWAGDFNRHHELWDDEKDRRLFTQQARLLAQPLVDMIGDFAMEMVLEKGIPTLRHKAWKTYLRVDNVFVSEELTDRILVCETKPNDTPISADHYPIDTIIDLTASLSKERRTRNFRKVDWKVFNEELANSEPAPLIREDPTPEDVEAEVESITKWIQDVISRKVTEVDKTPFTRRWWNEELEGMRKTCQTLKSKALRERDNSTHPIKKAHWDNFLEELDPDTIWNANRYLSNAPTDGATSRIPSLTFEERDGTKTTAISNEEKGRKLAKMFFPPRPENFVLTAPAENPPEVDHEV